MNENNWYMKEMANEIRTMKGNGEWNTDNERKWWMKYGQWKIMVNEIRTMKVNGEWNQLNKAITWLAYLHGSMKQRNSEWMNPTSI